jgi:hypothetical protein
MDEHNDDAPSSSDSEVRVASPTTLRRRKIHSATGVKPKVKREKGTFESEPHASDSVAEVSEVDKARAEGYSDGYKAAMMKFGKGGH